MTFSSQSVKIKHIIVEGAHEASFMIRFIESLSNYYSVLTEFKESGRYYLGDEFMQHTGWDITGFYETAVIPTDYQSYGAATVKRPVIFVNTVDNVVIILSNMEGETKYEECIRLIDQIEGVFLKSSAPTIDVSDYHIIVQIDIDQDNLVEKISNFESNLIEISTTLDSDEINIEDTVSRLHFNTTDNPLENVNYNIYESSSFLPPSNILIVPRFFILGLTTHVDSMIGNFDTMVLEILSDSFPRYEEFVQFVTTHIPPANYPIVEYNTKHEKALISVIGQPLAPGTNNSTIISKPFKNGLLLSDQQIANSVLGLSINWFLNQ